MNPRPVYSSELPPREIDRILSTPVGAELGDRPASCGEQDFSGGYSDYNAARAHAERVYERFVETGR
jgi:hypothetical protein